MSTRRQFLTVSSAALAASAMPCKLFAQSSAEVFSNRNLGAYSQGLLTFAMFERIVGSEFRAFLENGSAVSLKLLSVTDRTASAANEKQPGTVPLRGATGAFSEMQRNPVAELSSLAFDLHFSVGGPALDQRSYTLDHATLGRFVALVVPGVSAGNNTCSISFNYLAGATVGAAPVKAPILLHVPQTALPVGFSGSSVTSVPAAVNVSGRLASN